MNQAVLGCFLKPSFEMFEKIAVSGPNKLHGLINLASGTSLTR